MILCVISIANAKLHSQSLNVIMTIPNKDISKALKGVEAESVLLAPMCIDSVKGELAVGMIALKPDEYVNETKLIFVDSAGNVLEKIEWKKKLGTILPCTPTFRRFGSSLYFVGRDQKGMEIHSDKNVSLPTPWHPDEMKRRFPNVKIRYVKDVDDSIRPLFRITKKTIVSIDSLDTLHIYDRHGTSISSIKIMPLRFIILEGSDLIVGVYGDKLVIFAPPGDLLTVKLNPASERIDTSDVWKEIETLCRSDIHAEPELTGNSLFVWDDVPYFVAYTKAGIFVLRLDTGPTKP